MNPGGIQLIKRYKQNYHIADNYLINEEKLLKHWEMEKLLTDELLASTPETRWDVFSKCYRRLYSELEWLNEAIDSNINVNPTLRIPNIRFTLRIGSLIKTRTSRIYLHYLLMVEKLIALLPEYKFRQPTARLSQLALFFPRIFIFAEKD